MALSDEPYISQITAQDGTASSHDVKRPIKYTNACEGIIAFLDKVRGMGYTLYYLAPREVLPSGRLKHLLQAAEPPTRANFGVQTAAAAAGVVCV